MRNRGLGDYRIPKTMLTRSDGSRIPVNDIIDRRGFIYKFFLNILKFYGNLKYTFESIYNCYKNNIVMWYTSWCIYSGVTKIIGKQLFSVKKLSFRKRTLQKMFDILTTVFPFFFTLEFLNLTTKYIPANTLRHKFIKNHLNLFTLRYC